MAKLGILSIPPSLRETVDMARKAEAAGFDSVWTGEYFSRNAFTTLAAVAGATNRITIGSGIAYAFLRSPVQLATAAADVDELSGGRLTLGLGTGTKAQNEQWYGVPFGHPGPKLRETVQIARALWSHKGGPFKHTGKFFNLSIANFVRHSQVREKIPVYLGVVSPYMLRLAGRMADGILGHPTSTRSYFRQVIMPSVQQGLEQAGRSREQFETAQQVVTIIDRDGRQARRDAAKWLNFYYVARTFHSILDFHGWGDEKAAIVKSWQPLNQDRMAEAISERMWHEVLALVGTPDEVRRQWQELSTVADHIIFLAPAPYGGISFERYSENYDLIFELFGRKGLERPG